MFGEQSIYLQWKSITKKDTRCPSTHLKLQMDEKQIFKFILQFSKSKFSAKHFELKQKLSGVFLVEESTNTSTVEPPHQDINAIRQRSNNLANLQIRRTDTSLESMKKFVCKSCRYIRISYQNETTVNDRKPTCLIMSNPKILQ